MMKVLVGGLVGAVLGSGIWLGVEHFTQSSYGWMVCLVGVLAGVFARMSDRARLTPGTVRGGIAVIVTLAAIVFGRQVYAKLIQVGPEAKNAAVSLPKDMKAAADEQEPPAESSAADSSEAESTEAESTDEGSMPEKIAVLDRSAPAAVDASQKIQPNPQQPSEFDLLWMSLAALAAYIVSQVSETAASEKASEQPLGEGSAEPEK